MTNESQIQTELEGLNSTFNEYGFKFKMGDKGFSFDSIYPDNRHPHIKWAKVFIVTNRDGDDVQIGRITYQFVNNVMEMYYTKQYKPQDYEYSPDDNIFYYLIYYFAKKSVFPKLEEFIKLARQIKIVSLAKSIIWRVNNPYNSKVKIANNGKVFHTHRKRLTGRNIRYIINDLIRYASGLINEKPYADHIDMIDSLKIA